VDTTSNGCGTGYVGDDVGMIESNPNTNYGHCVSKGDCTGISKGYIDGNKCSSTCSGGKVADKVKEVTIGDVTILLGECISMPDCINTVKGFVQNDDKLCVESKDCGTYTVAEEERAMVGNNVTDFRVSEMKGYCIKQEECKDF